MADTATVEVTDQMASQDYDCDECLNTIHDETQYVRVAKLEGSRRKKNGRVVRSARTVEKYHPTCAKVAGYHR